ncbi:TPA: hypothetical protein ACH3X3_010378 [Trebouxia sp. C0006]
MPEDVGHTYAMLVLQDQQYGNYCITEEYAAGNTSSDTSCSRCGRLNCRSAPLLHSFRFATAKSTVLLWAYLNCTAFGPEQINLCGRLPKFLTSTRPVRLQWTVRCTQRAFQPVGTGHCLHRSHAANQI